VPGKKQRTKNESWQDKSLTANHWHSSLLQTWNQRLWMWHTSYRSATPTFHK